MNHIVITTRLYYLKVDLYQVMGVRLGVCDHIERTQKQEISHEFIVGAGTKNDTNFLKGLKMPDLDRGVETVVFG
jgi:hypothetical protein